MLELQNTKLLRKLSKTRNQSRDKLINVTQERDQLSSENALLRQECESLRSLFIRQQQQQIAFWAGPFMEMIMPKSSGQAGDADPTSAMMAPGAAAAMIAPSPPTAVSTSGCGAPAVFSHSDLRDTAKAPLAAVLAAASPAKSANAAARGGYYETDFVQSGLDAAKTKKDISSTTVGSVGLTDVAPGAARSDCVQNLLKDRDYWQQVARQLNSERHRDPPVVRVSLEKGTIDTRSTSQRSSVASAESESLGNTDIPWSDSGTESTRSNAEA